MPARIELPQGTIESILLPHGAVNTLGLVFTEKSSGVKFTYYTDCKWVPEEAVALAKGSAVVVLDGLRPEPHPTHMSISEAVQAADAIGAPLTYLTHLTHLTGHVEGAHALPAGVEFAYDGLRLSL
jgi:phosphoribosyl 1,2-cyclic phosphate phosphodiesterase